MGRVMSLIGVPIVLAPVLGPVLGSWLLDAFSWQFIFLINVPIGVLAVALGLKRLPHAASAPEQAGRLAGTGLAMLATGLPLSAGLALTATFVRHALRVERPLLDVRLFGNRAFSAAAVTTSCLGGALFGAMLILPLYYQVVRGEDALTTGLLLAPQGIGAAAAMFLSGRLTDRVGGGPVAVLGVAITALATVPFMLIGAGESYALLSLFLVARGFGIGMSIMPAMSAAYAVLEPEEIANATPQLTVLQRVGGSVGTAILSIVLANNLEGARSAAAAADAFGTTYLWALAVTLAAGVPAPLLWRIERRARAAATTAAAHDAIEDAYEESGIERAQVAVA